MNASVATDSPDLAVVIVSHECRKYLLACLTDLATARERLALEVFVVDNASTDGSVQAVRDQFPWVAIDASGENLGFARGNNRALHRIRADLLLFLNPDTRVTAEALAACVDELRRRPEIGILSPRIVNGDGRFDRRCMRGFPTRWSVACHVTGADRVLRDRWSGRYMQRWLPDDRFAEVEAVSGAVMACRTTAIRSVGGFNEGFFMYGEDIDLCLQVRAAGWRVVYWPGAEVTHLGRGSGWNVRSRVAWIRAIGTLRRTHG